jgi:hypothetical protein
MREESINVTFLQAEERGHILYYDHYSGHTMTEKQTLPLLTNDVIECGMFMILQKE